MQTINYIDRDAVKEILTHVSDENVGIAEAFLSEIMDLKVYAVLAPDEPPAEWDGISRCAECGIAHSPTAACVDR